MLILCIRSNKVGKRKPGLLSCDSDQTPVYVFGGTARLAHARTGRGSAQFQRCKEQVPRGVLSPFAGPSHHRGERQCPSSGHSFAGSFSTNPNSEVANGLSLNSTLGRHQWDRKAPRPPPNWGCRVESEPGVCALEQTRLRLLSWGEGVNSKSVLVSPAMGPGLEPLSPLSLPL